MSEVANSEQWYVIETEADPFKAHLRLAVAGLHLWFPIVVKRPSRNSSKPRQDTRSAKFGRYFFVRCVMTDVLWNAIRYTPHVRRILTAGTFGRPAAIPVEVIQWLQSEIPNEDDTSEMPCSFQPNDIVRLIEGPFAGQIGPVRCLDNKTVLCITLDIFGQSVPVIVRASQVEMVRLAEPAGHKPKARKIPSRSEAMAVSA